MPQWPGVCDAPAVVVGSMSWSDHFCWVSRFFKILVVLGLLIDYCVLFVVGIKKLKKLQKHDNEIIKVIIQWIIIVTYLKVIFLFASTGRYLVCLVCLLTSYVGDE